jgi:hypothetical protein
MGRQERTLPSQLYQTCFSRSLQNPQMLHMLQRKASEWSCNDQGGQPSEGKSTDMTHVTVTFSGHGFLCRKQLNSFDDHGMLPLHAEQCY